MDLLDQFVEICARRADAETKLNRLNVELERLKIECRVFYGCKTPERVIKRRNKPVFTRHAIPSCLVVHNGITTRAVAASLSVDNPGQRAMAGAALHKLEASGVVKCENGLWLVVKKPIDSFTK